MCWQVDIAGRNKGTKGTSHAQLETRGIGNDQSRQVGVDSTGDVDGVDVERGGRGRGGDGGGGDDALMFIMVVLCVK